MKNKVSKILIALLIFCMSISMLVMSVGATNEDESSETDGCQIEMQEYTAKEAADFLADKGTYPKKENFLFAGWYTTNDIATKTDQEVLQYVIRDSVPNGVDKVYALFVPDDVLNVKAQLSKNMIAGMEGETSGSIRFITTVNSLLYKQVGFDVSYVNSKGSKKSATASSSEVYLELYGVGTEEKDTEYVPTDFCAVSKYFKACNLNGVPATDFTVPFTVKPFWVTLDGSKVYGETVIKSMDDYFLEENVYVSSQSSEAADTEACGSEDKPFKTLEYALGKVKNQGTIHIVDSYATTSEFVWEKDNPTVKTVNITGGELDFTTLPEKVLRAEQGTDTPDDTSDDVAAVTANVLDINDSVTFMNTSLKFANGQQVYANGNTVEITESVTWANDDAYIGIYGGAHSAPLNSDTNLILGAGQYTRVFGGGNYDSPLTGNVNVTLSGSINPNVDPSTHNRDYAVFGGGVNKSSVSGDINLNILDETVRFRHVYGGGEWNYVKGNIHLNFGGSAFSVFGGGYDTSVTGDIYLTMIGGWTEQIFGGSNHGNVSGSTNVNVQGGEIVRRVYGGCYNELNEDDWIWEETYCVTGHTNVSISPKADVSLDSYYFDRSIYAISRGPGAFENEWSAFIFNETLYENYKSKLGYNDTLYKGYFSEITHHYLITTNGNTEDGSLGTVTSDGDYIRIKPRRGYSAVVVDKETSKEYYTESEGVFKLPELTITTEPRELTVTFSEVSSSVDKSGYKARIDGAYYDTLEEAVAAAQVLDSKETVVVTVLQNVEVSAQMNITSKVTIQNEAGKDVTVYRGDELAETDMFDVESTGTLTLIGVGSGNSFVFDGRTKEEADVNTSLEVTVGSTGSLIKAEGNLFVNNITIQYAKKTGNGYGGAINTSATKNKINITDSTFANNFAGFRGGAIFATNERKSAITISGCIFNNNTAEDAGGAICVASKNTLNIEDSTFMGNIAKKNFGGAVAMGSNLSTVNLSGEVIFDKNTSGGTGYGGGAIMTGSVLSVEENADITIKNNTASNLGGGIYFNAGTKPKLELGEGAVVTMSGNSDKNGDVDIAVKKGMLTKGDRFVYGNNEEKTISEVVVDPVTYNVDINGYLTQIVELRHEETTTSYASLQEALKQAVDGDTIVLLDDITLKNQLTISKSVTLTTDGVANRTISCGSETIGDHIIVVAATDKDVILKGASEDSQLIMDGTGVILTKAFVHLGEAANTTMEYVTMQNIVKDGTDTNGGAIYNEAPLLVQNCTFTNCSVTTDNTKNNGGAICSTRALTIEGSDFMGNKAGYRGGAIYTSADGTTIKDCNFGDGTDANKNSAVNAGGAICVAGTTLIVNIENSTFKGNTAGYFGGAVGMTGSQATVNLSKEVIFEGNTAYTSDKQVGSNTHGGGAISTGKALNIADGATVTITNNTVEHFGYGGGVYFQAGATPVFSLGEGASLTMSSNTDAKYGDADIVIPSGKAAATFSFNGSYAISSIYTTADTLITLGDASSDTNPAITTVTLIDGASGTSVAEGDQLVAGSTQADTIFTVLYDETEYALDNDGCLVAKGIALKHDGTTTRYATLADAVSMAVDGDTIVVEKDVTLDASLKIDTTITITTDGAADRTIYCGEGAVNTHVISSSASNIEITLEGKSENSRLIFDGNSKNGVELTNAFIYSGKSGDSTLAKKVTIQYVTMQNIVSTYNYGSAICSNAPIDVNDSWFVECSTTHASANGGAIYLAATASGTTFTKCRFEKCSSGHRGGAIYSNGGITVADSIFTENISTNAGGAILMSNVKLSIKESIFEKNEAGHFGGAVGFSQPSGTLELYDTCKFYGNSSSTNTEIDRSVYRGGAILAPVNFKICAGAWIEMYENDSKYEGSDQGGDAICLYTDNQNLTTFVIEEGASLFVYNNPKKDDTDKDICIKNGKELLSFMNQGYYSTLAPTTE